MTIDIINTALPPKFDAIGHYTALFSEELAHFAEVRLLAPTGLDYDEVVGVPVLPCFSVETKDGIRGVIEPIVARQPDWVLLQYNPFLYGHRGYAPQLVPTLRELKRRCPKTKLAVMVHENFVPCWESVKFTVMASWQVPQYWQLGQTADMFFTSAEAWAKHARGWFKKIPVHHLPVGSTMPHVPLTRSEARQRLGIPDNVVAVGVFGTAHVSRLLPLVASTLKDARQNNVDARLLYIGPDGAAVREVLGELEPLCADGPLPADEVSRRFSAMDLYLAPFIDGVSTRRTSLMTSFQHGIAAVGTDGHHTDTVFREAAEKAILLAPVGDDAAFARQTLRLIQDASLRERIAAEGKALYEAQFDWKPVVQSFLAGLRGKG
ncbi:glycosyltransferase family 4 protein [Armatimonas rosea]|uniref:Glycosyltransferase involved in cell wall biosynthesis n=1 Tax=Armatimonas rosea TaxID=685828 RepID=A0A7W9SKS7_ARMRO|nr:glycosyltransferase family 4 protein [Armatimonas rosea]MBB6048457.1 glycosyltransferase involved in cell wall biosynthesis [Armatimonas rosea]